MPKNSPLLKTQLNSNGSKDNDRNLTVLTAPSSKDIPFNRDSNNDNNNGENLTDIRTEFEALKTFLMEELYHLRQKVKKLNILEVIPGNRDIMIFF